MSALTRASLIAALLAGAAFAVSAQTAKQPAADPGAKGTPPAEMSFASADKNSDGKLSKEEAASIPSLAAQFDKLDKDKDGFLSPMEFSAAPPAK
ncbi:MAG TPA: hypothetical protein VJ598_08150 [Albitalea sp.]|nr:hypothetical protein [Albitalea sp.]